LNGSRLVYKMEKHAMQILNLFFNKVFSVLVSWLIGQEVKDTLWARSLYRMDYQRVHEAFASLRNWIPS